MTGVLRLALVDDDLMVRSALSTYLVTAPDLKIVLSTDDASQVIRAVEAGELDLVIMDVHMPGLDGIEATARIKEVSPDLPVLVLTTFDEDAHLLGAPHCRRRPRPGAQRCRPPRGLHAQHSPPSPVGEGGRR